MPECGFSLVVARSRPRSLFGPLRPRAAIIWPCRFGERCPRCEFSVMVPSAGDAPRRLS